MRTPAVTFALLIILALGFGTAALADDGGKPNSHANTTATGGVGKTESTPEKTTPGDDTATTDDNGTDTTPTTTTTGTDAPAAPSLPPAAAPVLDHSAAVAAVSGDVRVKLPGGGAYASLAGASSVPMGATVDASNGSVKLTSAHDASGTPQSAVFHDGVFKIVGQSKGKTPVTELSLTGGDFTAACGKAALSFARRPPVRQLWGSGHGNFKTSGRYSAATVRGTIWLTRDTCDGTLTIVKRGVVAVRDRVHKITVLVHAGHSYFAQAPIPAGASSGLSGF